ncbi:MAG: hypothetical protein ACJ75R_11380 [Solirubrobacterales bacterium]
MPLDAPTSAGAGLRAAVPTHSERRGLLRALLIGRGIERALAPSRNGAGPVESVLAAIAAGSALEPADRLVVPRQLVAAHLAAGADPSVVASARVGSAAADPSVTPLRGLSSETASGLALGIALALQQAGDRGAAVVILERRWVESEQCRKVLEIAANRRLPLALVTLDHRPVAADGIPVMVDWRNLEAVRGAVLEAASAARAGDGPATVVCASPGPDGDLPSRRARFRSEPLDPVTIYERRLMVNGFSRPALNEVRADAASTLDRALTGLTPAGKVGS